MRQGTIFVAFTCAVMTVQGALVLRSETPLGITAMAAFKDMPHVLVGVLLLASVACTLLGTIRRDPLQGIILLAPQQLVLTLMAFGPIQAIVRSEYANGVALPWDFIGADQIIVPLAVVFHTWALLAMARDHA